MKKIGISTFHYVDNYGAVLQAWALRKYINGLTDCKAEIINYVPKNYSYDLSLYENSEEARRRLKKKRELFENFLYEECSLSQDVKEKIEDEDYDYICVGSDQVWNLSLREAANCEYLLPNVKRAKKISYAASIGVSVEQISKYKGNFEQYLSDFSMISVREKEHIEFIKKVSDKDCACVLDPTFLVDVKDYKGLIKGNKKSSRPFIFLYWLVHAGELDKRKNLEIVNRLSRELDCDVIHNIPNVKDYAINNNGGCMCYEGVEDFLWYIANAKMVVTNSYHACLLSIRFGTRFYSTVVNSMRSRIDTLTAMFNISGNLIEDYSKTLKMYDCPKVYIDEEKYKINLEESEKYLKCAFEV